MSEMDPFARSTVTWLLAIAAAIYATKILWFVLSRFIVLRSPPAGIRIEEFLVALACLVLVMEPVHMASHVSAEGVLQAWNERLVYVAIATLTAGFLSGAFGAGPSLGIAFSLSWPLMMYGAFGWGFYLLLHRLVPPDEAALSAELLDRSRPFLVLMTTFPGIAFGSGLIASALGRVVQPVVHPAAENGVDSGKYPFRFTRSHVETIPVTGGQKPDQEAGPVSNELLAEITRALEDGKSPEEITAMLPPDLRDKVRIETKTRLWSTRSGRHG